MKIQVFIAFFALTVQVYAQQLPLSKEELDKKEIFSGFVAEKQSEVFRIQVQNPGSFPEDIKKYTQLHELYIIGNDWDYSLNTIPEDFYLLPYITTLSFSNTEISYISGSVSNLKNLRELYIRSNRITSLPQEMSMMSNLQKIGFDNNITDIPVMPSIKVVDCSIFNDTLPNDWIDKFPSAEVMRLHAWSQPSNGSEIIQAVAQKMQLKELYLEGIDLDSATWVAIAGEKLLTKLSLPSGCFDASLTDKFSNLTYLNIAYPSLFGQNPIHVFKVLSNLKNLEYFETDFKSENIDGYKQMSRLKINFTSWYSDYEFAENGPQLAEVKGIIHLSIRDVASHISLFKELISLNVSGADQFDPELFFTWLLPLSSLQELYIQGQVFNGNYKALSQLSSLKKCYVFNYGWNALTEEKKQEIRNTLKTCEFVFMD